MLYSKCNTLIIQHAKNLHNTMALSSVALTLVNSKEEVSCKQHVQRELDLPYSQATYSRH